jgi:hypothetical protein
MDYLQFALSNFGLSMFALAVLFILIHLCLRIKHISYAEIVYRWMALFALGCTSIYAAIMHLFFAQMSAAEIGWATSPFQFEVGMADLALGVLGVLSFRAHYGFRLATVIAAICMFWGDAAGHIYQMIMFNNFNPGNAGSWFAMDVIVPAILLLCLVKLKPVHRHHG